MTGNDTIHFKASIRFEGKLAASWFGLDTRFEGGPASAETSTAERLIGIAVCGSLMGQQWCAPTDSSMFGATLMEGDSMYVIDLRRVTPRVRRWDERVQDEEGSQSPFVIGWISYQSEDMGNPN